MNDLNKICKEIAENDRKIYLNEKLNSLLIAASAFLLMISGLLLTINL